MFSAGMTVQCRGQKCIVVDASPLMSGELEAYRIRVRAIDGPLRNQEWPVISTLEPVTPDEIPPLSLERIGRDARFRLLHEAFRLTLAPPPNALVAAGRSRVRFEMYQQIPALRMLSLPRPRILNASDVGLGKTIETGLCLRELMARRRADRILIVCPAGIAEQWQEELASKFGLEFKVFDRDGVHEAKKQIEIGGNPWATEPRIIASFDYIKRRDGAFREIQNVRFSVIVCDEVHHLADNTQTDDVSERHRLAQWIAKASDALLLLSATPHSGYDESFASLLRLLEPTLVPDIARMQYRQYSRHLIRHLKRHIKKPNGDPFFVPPAPSQPLPVEMTVAEDAVHRAVSRQAKELDEQAAKLKATRDQYALRMVATVLRKRAASSLAALRVTINNRMQNLAEAVERVEVRRDHLRSLRKGETVPDEALTQLEIDVHRSFLAQIRTAGAKIRSIEQEKEDLLELEELATRCPTDTESKAERLLAELVAVHAIHPDEKFIVFSEYTDTVDWLIEFLGCRGYEGRIVRYVGGDLRKADRKQALADFAKPEFLLLVTTDAASEGLNLQEHCHRVIHYELPFNPNRMLQRQGRVDRYGQTEACQFAYLYAEKTYEGEVLARLFQKIERQIKALGSVGDALGALQADHIEDLLAKSPEDLKTAIEEADRAIDAELARLSQDRTKIVLGDDSPEDAELKKLALAIDAGTHINVELPDFIARAVTLAGGKCERRNDLLSISAVPSPWLGGRIPQQFDGLYIDHKTAPKGTKPDEILEHEHRLVQAAIRWIRQTRYSREDDHRLAARLVAEINQPDVIATFLANVRAADGTEMEQLFAIRIQHDGTISKDDALTLLYEQGVGNVPVACITRLFADWWAGAVEQARAEAIQRADRWKSSVQQARFADQGELKRQFDTWAAATRAAITAGYETSQRALPGMETPLPPTVQRRLKEHRKEVDEYGSFLDRRLRFEVPQIEQLGVLLRVPAKEVG
jgi:superfamily II DNA or RNA helicase